MNLYDLEEQLENYIGMYKEDVEEFLYDYLDDNIENVIDDNPTTIFFVCNNFQVILNYEVDEITEDFIFESYNVEII